MAGLSATLLGGVAGDRLRARFPGSYFLVSGMAMLVGFPFMLLTLHAPFPSIWVWLFVTCFCLFFNTGPTNTILANVTHPSIRAAGFALNIFVIHALGDVISPVIIGDRQRPLRHDRAFTLVGVMFVVAGILWLLGARHLAARHGARPDAAHAGAGLTAPNSGAAAYGLVRTLSRVLLKLFYDRIDVVGAEHVPATGPLIVAANHHNSVVDAMLLLAVIPRRLRTLAKAPLFNHPLIGPFLRLMGALRSTVARRRGTIPRAMPLCSPPRRQRSAPAGRSSSSRRGDSAGARPPGDPHRHGAHTPRRGGASARPSG